ncbi:MAG: hypothetical protein ACXVB9_04060 [Bdellovibrionota bacterium]
MRDPDDKALDQELRNRHLSAADQKALLERREELAAAAERVNQRSKLPRASALRSRSKIVIALLFVFVLAGLAYLAVTKFGIRP